jgi:hypothetical protein
MELKVAEFCYVCERQVYLHLSEGAYATPHHMEYDIVRVADDKVIRRAVCPSRVDAMCAELNVRARAQGVFIIKAVLGGGYWTGKAFSHGRGDAMTFASRVAAAEYLATQQFVYAVQIVEAGV